jgi:hypothetical protein
MQGVCSKFIQNLAIMNDMNQTPTHKLTNQQVKGKYEDDMGTIWLYVV